MGSEKIKSVLKRLNQAAGLLVPGVGDVIALAVSPEDENYRIKKNAAIGTGLVTAATALGYVFKNVDLSSLGIGGALAPNASLAGLVNQNFTMVDGKQIDDILLFALMNILMAFAIRAAVLYWEQYKQDIGKGNSEKAAFVMFGGAAFESQYESRREEELRKTQSNTPESGSRILDEFMQPSPSPVIDILDYSRACGTDLRDGSPFEDAKYNAIQRLSDSSKLTTVLVVGTDQNIYWFRKKAEDDSIEYIQFSKREDIASIMSCLRRDTAESEKSSQLIKILERLSKREEFIAAAVNNRGRSSSLRLGNESD